MKFRILHAAVALPAIIFLQACLHETPPSVQPAMKAQYSIASQALPYEILSDGTKSTEIIAEEQNGSGATIGIYNAGGVLVFCEHTDGDFADIVSSFNLNVNETYSYYMITGAISKEGGITAFPAKERDVADMEYVAGDLERNLRDCGTDKAGAIIGMRPADADRADGKADGIITIPLTSLWAKVTVSLDFSEVSDILTPVTASQGKGSRVFRPFDRDGAINTDGSLTGTAGGSRNIPGNGEELCFYFPENVLGNLLPGNGDPMMKSIDNPALADVRESVAYIQIGCRLDCGTGLDGDLAYRFCIGYDTTEDFSVRRGTCYKVTLRPRRENIFENVWKIETEGLEDNRSLKVVAQAGLHPPGSSVLIASRYSDGTSIHTGFTSDGIYGSEFGWAFGTAQEITAYLGGNAVPCPGSPYNGKGLKCRQCDAVFAGYPLSWPAGTGGTLSQAFKEYVNSWSTDGKCPFCGMVWLTAADKAGIEAGTSDLYVPNADALSVVVPQDAAFGDTFRYAASTFDGRLRDAVSIVTGPAGSISIRADLPEYVGQEGSISVGAIDGISRIAFSQDGGSGNLSVTPSGAYSANVTATGAGEISVGITGYTPAGAAISLGMVNGNIRYPRLYCEASGTARPDLFGTGLNAAAGYMDDDGFPLDEGSFDPVFYESFLKPSATLSSGLGQFLEWDGATLKVKRYTAGNASILDYLGQTDNLALVISATDCAGIVPVTVAAEVDSPVIPYGPDIDLGKVATGFVTMNAEETALTGITEKEGSLILENSFTLQRPSYTPSAYSGGRLCMSFEKTSSSPDKYGLRILQNTEGQMLCGPLQITVPITHRASGEVLDLPIGKIENYIVTGLGQSIVRTNFLPGACAHLTGSSYSALDISAEDGTVTVPATPVPDMSVQPEQVNARLVSYGYAIVKEKSSEPLKDAAERDRTGSETYFCTACGGVYRVGETADTYYVYANSHPEHARPIPCSGGYINPFGMKYFGSDGRSGVKEGPFLPLGAPLYAGTTSPVAGEDDSRYVSFKAISSNLAAIPSSAYSSLGLEKHDGVLWFTTKTRDGNGRPYVIFSSVCKNGYQ